MSDTVLDLFDACKSVDTAIDCIYRSRKLGVFLLERSNRREDLLQHCGHVRRRVTIGSHCSLQLSVIESGERWMERDIDEQSKGSQNRMIWYEANNGIVCLFAWSRA